MIGKEYDLPVSTTAAETRVSASLPRFQASVEGLRRRKSLAGAGQRDIFYGEDDVADLMFREEEVEQDTVMRAYRSNEAMKSIQDTRRSRTRFSCFQCFDFLKLFFSRDRR
ncbi:uncharacterized protein LOC17877174 [Capsella rubella]|uniref:uncharacterized protein LOC17877174 n=1 Tax=Capsella rubella TaxID=81985 RepID=UPI000CD50053|nr:uncharacterized protein LOC17877174 [Capsella rubella]XP_023640412.1 uncharacterized protein LOC17877174 [Capsella rubella]